MVDSINRSRFFSVLADETTDISCQEQLNLCARYVSDDFAIEESFLQFVPITDLSGKNLASTILNNLSDIGIDVSKMRGQGYDGATAMSGRLNGAQAYIREIIPTVFTFTVQPIVLIWLSLIHAISRRFVTAWEQ